LHVVCLWFKGIIVYSRAWTFGFWIWIWMTSITPWILDKFERFLNPSMTCNMESLSNHWTWFLNTTITTCINFHKTSCTVDLLMAKNSLHSKYFKTCVNLYKEQATIMLMGNVHLNLVFFFSILCFNLFVNCLTKVLLTQKCSIRLFLSYWIIRNWQYQVVDLALTQSPSSWLKRRSYTQDNLYLWKIKTFIFETQVQNLYFEKKEKMVNHLQNLEMGMRTLFKMTKEQQVMCLNSCKKLRKCNYASRKILTSFITTILSNFAQRGYLPKANKKMWKFQSKLDRKAKITQTYDSYVECSELVKTTMKNTQKRCSEK
jgi:hypothetical protein